MKVVLFTGHLGGGVGREQSRINLIRLGLRGPPTLEQSIGAQGASNSSAIQSAPLERKAIVPASASLLVPEIVR